MYTDHCAHGHTVRSAADRTSQGYCRKCKAEYDRERRRMHRAALGVVEEFEAAGVRFHNAGVPLSAAEVARQLVIVYGQPTNELLAG